MKHLIVISGMFFCVSSWAFEGEYALKNTATECFDASLGKFDCGGVLSSLKYAKKIVLSKSGTLYVGKIENRFDNYSDLLPEEFNSDESFNTEDGSAKILNKKSYLFQSNTLIFYQEYKIDDGYKPSQAKIIRHTIERTTDGSLLLTRTFEIYKWDSNANIISTDLLSYERSSTELSKF